MDYIECPVSRLSGHDPERIAIISPKKDVTYGELERKIAGTVRNLKRFGITENKSVALVPDNTIEYIILIFSVLRLGGTVVLLNFRFPKEKIAEIVRDIKVDLIVAKSQINAGIDCIGTGDIISEEDNSSGPDSKAILGGRSVILTSGSTGKMKGVVLPTESHYFSAVGSNENIRLNGDDKWLLILPLFHVGGFAIPFRVFLAGASVVLPKKKDKGVGDLIFEYGVSHVSMVSAQLLEFVDYLEQKEITSPETLKAVLVGGSAVPVSLLFRALDLNIPVYTTYGMTETGSQVTTTGGVLRKEKVGSSGSSLKYREVKVGKGGNIFVKGKTLFSGYVTKAGISPPPLTKDGWFDTGDLGEVDESGDLFVRGRKDSMFVSGGENIFPEEIERELLKIEGVTEAVVVPIPDKKYGMRPVAFINTGGKEISGNEIVESLKVRLPGFKIPDRFYFLEENRKNLKRDRADLQEKAIKGEGLTEIQD